ncbi:MAG: hypothetical protein SWL02_06455 [Pseudomonadota bacterium]|nr:hypothetical protein [Pseudomonadota bacterium]
MICAVLQCRMKFLLANCSKTAQKIAETGAQVMVGHILKRTIPEAEWFPSPWQFGNPRFAWALKVEEYNMRVVEANKLIKSSVDGLGKERIAFWEHFGMWAPHVAIWHADGVH